jgi:hypothetical protein
MSSKPYLDDHLRIINNNLALHMAPESAHTEHRYEQRGYEYTLRSWCDKDMSVTASMVDRPPWLARIIDLAIVGGHIHPVPFPPPDLIVWFRTTVDTNDLIEFVDFTNP